MKICGECDHAASFSCGTYWVRGDLDRVDRQRLRSLRDPITQLGQGETYLFEPLLKSRAGLSKISKYPDVLILTLANWRSVALLLPADESPLFLMGG